MSPSRIRHIRDLCDPAPTPTEHPQSSAVSQYPHGHSQSLSRLHSSSSSVSNHHSRHQTYPPVQLPSIDEVLRAATRQPSSASTSTTVAVTRDNASRRSTTHSCQRCGRTFTRRADVAKHVRVVHDRVKNYVCDICGRRFGRKDYLAVSWKIEGKQQQL